MSLDNIQKGRNFDVVSASAVDTSSTSNSTDPFPVVGCTGVSFHTVYSGVTGTQPVFQLQYSNDGTNWVDKSGKSYTTVGGSGSGMIIDDTIGAARWARVKVSTASTTGSMTCYMATVKNPV